MEHPDHHAALRQDRVPPLFCLIHVSIMDPNSAKWEHCLDHAALSDVGLRRSNNQDCMATAVAGSQEAWQQRGHLFMVADGMGAHAAGELASKLACDVVPLTYNKLAKDRTAPEAMLDAVREANSQINSRGQASDDFKGMGTTVDVLTLLPQGALLAHVGDSRVYRLRKNQLEQLTFDHSLVWEMRAAGQIPDDEAPNYVPKNIITRSLGPNPNVQVDLEGPFPLEVNDTFLLCSDGLSGPVKDEELGTILRCLSPAEAVQSLVDLANLRGGPDNITVIVVRVTGPQIAKGSTGEVTTTGPRPHPTVHPLLWTLLGAFGLAAIGAFALQFQLVALAALVGTLIFALAVLVQRYSDPGAAYVFDGRPLGKGPYTTIDCKPNAEIVARLATTVQELRGAAAHKNWDINWDRFNDLAAKATAATQAADHAAAVQEHCQTISFVMAELRRQHGDKPSGDDSSIDLF